MRPWVYRVGGVVVALPVLAMFALRFAVAPYADASRNAVVSVALPEVSEAALALHEAAFVADLHADSLIWGRDLSRRHSRGHIDLPRLREGGVDLQVLGAVTRTPKGLNYDHNLDETDPMRLLYIGTWRGPGTWFSARGRALALARELRSLDTTVVTTASDLDAPGLKTLLAIEGMHALEGRAEALEELHAAGYRMMGLAHFFDNAVAGSAHGAEQFGLTALGRELLPRMEALGITVDLAHASPAAFADAIALSARPVVVSHTGVQATCPGPRNLTDAQIRQVAATGGVIGIGYWDGAACDVSAEGIVAAIQHAIAVGGPDSVALGSDFDGNISAPFDASQLPVLTEAMMRAGLPDDVIRKVLGGNARRVLSQNLPD